MCRARQDTDAKGVGCRRGPSRGAPTPPVRTPHAKVPWQLQSSCPTLPCPILPSAGCPLRSPQLPKNTALCFPPFSFSAPPDCKPALDGPGGPGGTRGDTGGPPVRTHHGAARGGRCGGRMRGVGAGCGAGPRGGRGADTLAHSAGWAAERGGGGRREEGRASRELKAAVLSSPARARTTTLSPCPSDPQKSWGWGQPLPRQPPHPKLAKTGSQQILGAHLLGHFHCSLIEPP